MVTKIQLLFFTLLFSLNYTSSLQNDCPKCGTMQVPYPLSTTPNCGNQNYKLHCTNNDTLHFPSADNLLYKILIVDLTQRTLTIEPPQFTGKCQSPDLGFNGLRIDENSPFNISSRNTVMLFNCSENILLSPLNCSLTSPCRLFEQKTEQGKGCLNTLCCSYLKDSSMTARRIRVRAGGCSAYTSVVDFNPNQTSVDAWRFGIELQWLPPN